MAQDTDLRSRLLARIASNPHEVWTLGDFADLGGRAVIDKTLQRLTAAGDLRCIDRGLYDRTPNRARLSGRYVHIDEALKLAVTRVGEEIALLLEADDGLEAPDKSGEARLNPSKSGLLDSAFVG